MPTLVEMSEAHLLNVQSQISSLEKQKADIQQKIEEFTNYFTEGLKEYEAAKTTAQIASPADTQEDPSPTLF